MKKMNAISYIKAFVTAITSMLASMLGILWVPVYLMVMCNVIDYATGLAASGHRDDGGISSYKSIRGVIKKVTMWLLVGVGGIIDQLLAYAANVIGYQLPFIFLVACVVAIWIICNELISILENMVDIGIAIPPFLMPIVNNLKTTIEKAGDIEDDKDN